MMRTAITAALTAAALVFLLPAQPTPRSAFASTTE